MPESDATTDDVAEALAEDITSHVASWPSINKLDRDDTVTLRIGYFVDDDRDSSGVTVQAHFGPPGLTEQITDLVESYLDQRKFKVSDNGRRYRDVETWTVGSVTITGDGEVEAVDIDEEYLKPSADTDSGDA